MGKRFLNVTFALGLVIGLMAGVVGSASAADTSPAGTESQWIFFPYVPNGEMLDGAGPWYGTVTIQNTEDYRVIISFGQTAGGVDTSQHSTTLEAHASKTFSADQLGIASPGAGVVVQSAWDPVDDLPDSVCQDTITSENLTRGGTANTADQMSGSANPDSSVVVTQTVNGVTNTFSVNTDYLVKNHNSIDWSPAGAEPIAGSNYTVTYSTGEGDCRAPIITGVEKHVMATPSAAGKTSSAQTSVDGYTAIPEQDVPWGPGSAVCHDIWNGSDCYNAGGYIVGFPDMGAFDGHSYLPIVQTNSGWNSVIHITNVDPSSPDFASVTITLYTAAGQGAFGPSMGSFTALLNQGDSATIDLSKDMGIPDGWVGSAWITSDYGVVANVNRQKPATDMALTNTAAPSLLATTSCSAASSDDCPPPFTINSVQSSGSGMFQMVAPLILKAYNGWNSGINIANISELTNTVTVTWVGPTGNVVGSDSVTIPAKAMEYIYTPNTQDLGLNSGFVGAAVLTSLLPFHAAIDEVKYSGTGQDVGQAMSYIATDAGASAAWCAADSSFPFCDWNKYRVLKPYGAWPSLNVPLIQKGSPLTGLGDTSGINLFNSSASASTTDWISFYQPSGALAAPTLNAPYEITLGALNTATIYTMDFSEMSAGFQGSAQIVPVSGAGVIFGVSNNVNYDVAGDGSAAFNAVNAWGQFRLYCSQQGTNSWADNGFGSCIYFDASSGNGG
ncbi:MAG TPA: DUF4815 domain-containing protein [Nitrolancea sp.]